MKECPQSLEAKILARMDEPFAMGLLEDRNAAMVKKYARGIRRYLEAVRLEDMPPVNGALYPSGTVSLWNLGQPASMGYNYSYSIHFNRDLFLKKREKYLTDERALSVAWEILGTLQNYTASPLSPKYCIGGNGYTHSIIDYRKILTQGLPTYKQEILNSLSKAETLEQRDFYAALQETFDAIMAFMQKCINKVKCGNNGQLAEALEAVSQRSPVSFYEAMVMLNFMYYLDGCDSVGNLDAVLSPFFTRYFATGSITDAEAEKLLSAFFFNVNECSGWHMILGNKGADEHFTVICLKAMKCRRPNAGLKISPETSDAVWNAAFDCLAQQTANPAFYNDPAYRAGALVHAGVKPEDLDDIAYGGCTEFMVAGKSNVGSIDSGINLLEILDGMISRIMVHDRFDGFLTEFKETVRREIKQAVAETNLNQQAKALYRPQLLRSLFIDDCLNNGVEYNAGGARYNGGVINVAGIANTANSLYVLQQIFASRLNINRDQLLELLAGDFTGHKDIHNILLQQPKYGNSQPEVDELARDISDFTFNEILQYRCFRGNGFYIPAVIMFVTYTGEGKNIQATPDGRMAGSPIADSCGPMQGTDLDGPTSMLRSTALLPQAKGLGTMVLNLRVRAEMVKDPQLREKFKYLLQSYFAMGGLQVQVTVLDAETLKQAMAHPEEYGSLVIRIGGYTEYFHRLTPELQQEVIKRSEH
ncbi:MAG: pyruvate formate lyase family protein [Lentisphaerota bacterium]